MSRVPRRGSALSPSGIGHAAWAWKSGHRGAPWLLAAMCLSAPCLSRTTERAYALSPGGWSLERFGTDVVVLRSASSPPSSGNAGLLFGCAGGERRFRLTFPVPVVPPGANRVAEASVSVAGPDRSRPSVAARFDGATATTLTLTSAATDATNPVSRLARLFTGEPRALDVLVSWGSGPVVVTQLDVFRLMLRGQAPARNLVDQFLADCGRPLPRQAD